MSKPRPIARFSVTVRSGKTERCWWTKWRPSSRASWRRHVAQVDGLAFDQSKHALVGLYHPGQDLDQGRLARAVAAEQRVDLSASDVEADVVEGLGHPVGLRNSMNR